MSALNRLLEIVAAWDVGTVRKVAAIHPATVFEVERSNGAPLILKGIGLKNQQVTRRFEFEYDVLCHLDRAGVPVAVPILDRRGSPLAVRNGRLSHAFTTPGCDGIRD